MQCLQCIYFASFLLAGNNKFLQEGGNYVEKMEDLLNINIKS